MKDYLKLGCWEDITLGARMEEWAGVYQNDTAVIDGDRIISYAQLNDYAREWARFFRKRGLKKGDRAAIQLPNSIEFIAVSFGLFRLGVIPVFILPAQRFADIDGICKVAKPRVYIVADKFMGFDYGEMTEQLRRANPVIEEVLCISEGAFVFPEMQEEVVLTDAPGYKDTAFLLLSGGTTNIPKLIPRKHGEYDYNSRIAARKAELNKNSVYLAVLPIAHNFPWGIPGVLGTFSVGGKVVLSKTTSYDEVFPLIEEHRVTITSVVPAILNMYLDVLEWEDSYDLSSLDIIQVGGAKLEKSLAVRVAPELKCKLQQVFGIAEGLICFTSLDDPDEIVISCQGKPLSEEDEIMVVDQNGKQVLQGSFGELLMKGPYTIEGYYNAPQINKEVYTEDGYFKTGDRVCITAEGNLFVDGRVVDQINRGGEKIMPSEVEGILLDYEEVAEAYVVPVPDEEMGQKSFAFIKCNGSAVSVKEIYAYMRERGISGYKVPDYVEAVEAFPLTNIGKINRKELRNTAVRILAEKGI